MYYQILLFIFGLYGLLGTVFIRNILMEYEIPPSTIKNMAEFIPYIGIPVILTAWFLFLKTSIEIVGKEISSYGSFLYFGSIVTSLLAYILIIFGIYGKGTNDTIVLVSYSKYGFIGLELLTFAIAFFVLYRYGLSIKHKHKKQLVMWFANINLLTVVGTIIVFTLTKPNTAIEKVYMVMFFMGQVPSVVFLSYYLNKYFELPTSNISKEELIGLFISNYQLSKREWEIVEHICKGSTNAQISEVLFISLQTVKDHVYHIYQKTGVKNRVQLVNKVSTL